MTESQPSDRNEIARLGAEIAGHDSYALPPPPGRIVGYGPRTWWVRRIFQVSLIACVGLFVFDIVAREWGNLPQLAFLTLSVVSTLSIPRRAPKQSDDHIRRSG